MRWLWLVFLLTLLVAGALYARLAQAHDIYTGVHNPKTGQLCCGGDDCQVTTYREKKGEYEFLTRESKWVAIPEERIIFLPLPGDVPDENHDNTNRAHLCYRLSTDTDASPPSSVNVFGPIYLYCAFIPPGGV